MSQEQPKNSTERRIPNKGDVINALLHSEMNATGEKNHAIDGAKALVEQAFNSGEGCGWEDEDILFFRLAEQTLRLLVDKKIKPIDNRHAKFMWTSDSAPYNEEKLIG